MTGANALLAKAGGDQGIAFQAIREQGLDQIEEDTGLQSMEEANQKYFGALEGSAAEEAKKQQQIMAKYGLMSSLLGHGYDARRRGGLFNPETLAGALQAFAGSALGGRPKPT